MLKIGIIANTRKEAEQILKEIFDSSDISSIYKTKKFKDGYIKLEDETYTIVSERCKGKSYDQLIINSNVEFFDIVDIVSGLLSNSCVPHEYQIIRWE